jgi:hypothetical protein
MEENLKKAVDLPREEGKGSLCLEDSRKANATTVNWLLIENI